MYIMTLVPLFIVLPLIAAAAWFFRHKIKDAMRRCRGRVARARHSISSGGKDDAKIESANGEFSHEMRQQQFSQAPPHPPRVMSGYVDQEHGGGGGGMRKLSKLSNTSVASRHFYRDAKRNFKYSTIIHRGMFWYMYRVV